MKLRLFRTNIYSMLLYASSTWKATVPVFRKRQAFINSYLCYVSSVNSSLIHWYTNEEIRRWTGQTHVDENADRFHIEKRWQLHCYIMSCSGTHYVRIGDKWFILELHCAENGGRLHASRKVWRTWPRTHGGNNPFFADMPFLHIFFKLRRFEPIVFWTLITIDIWTIAKLHYVDGIILNTHPACIP